MGIVHWADPNLSVEDLSEFYEIDESSVPEDRPYIWYMVVHSNGITALGNDSLPQHIALAHVRGIPATAGAKADHRALQFGWAYADAVLGGAEIPRREPDVTWTIDYQDLLDYRTKLKGERQPIKVLLTKRAEKEGPKKFDLGHPVFSYGRIIVFTSEAGERSIYEQVDSMERQPDLKVYALGKESVEDYAEMMRILRQDHGVRYLDVQGGGQTAGQLVLARLLDEYRETQPPTEFGAVYADGTPRPPVFGRMQFHRDNSPIWQDVRVGLAVNHVLVRKSQPLYRH